MDFHDKSDIKQSIKRIEQLFSCGIFQPQNSDNVLFRAAFIELLIAMRDLMFKTNKYATRISFSDDIVSINKITDVTGVIKHVRDAICHPDSQNHYIEKGQKASFNVLFGKGCICKINDYEQSSPYDDDICFFFGLQHIFMKRHIVRAFEEAKSKLLPLIEES
jgi:hypothetical protein